MSSDYKYHISELFTSPQGEGLYTGTLMHFIRTSGCTVGKPIKDDTAKEWMLKGKGVKMNDAYPNQVLPVWQEECTTYDGRKFLCDTDFRSKNKMTVDEIVKTIPEGVEHVCITGGEPLMHDLSHLTDFLDTLDKQIHIETSGTLPLKVGATKLPIWITVSPKFGVLPEMLDRADEIKLLVDEDFDVNKLPPEVLVHPLVFIQPVNETSDIDYENVRRCLEIQQSFPEWRISMQMHKLWHVR